MKGVFVFFIFLGTYSFAQRVARFAFEDQLFKVGAVCQLEHEFVSSFGNQLESEDPFYTENKAQFDQIIKFMLAHPELIIEIGCHTDSRGSEKENLKISLLKAESIKTTLVEHKVPEDHLLTNGYGESQLAVPEEKIEALSKDERENAHSMNRRTELKIIEINGI